MKERTHKKLRPPSSLAQGASKKADMLPHRSHVNVKCPAEGQMAMPYRLRRPEHPDVRVAGLGPAFAECAALRQTKHLGCLPRLQPKPSTKTIGHFDPFDLARRLEAHQAQCREAYKLQKQRSKEREAAQKHAAETGKVDTAEDFGKAASSQARERSEEYCKSFPTKLPASSSHSMKENLRLEPQAKRPRKPRLPRSRSSPSPRKVSIDLKSGDRERILRPSICLGHDDPKQILPKSASTRPHHPIQKMQGPKGSQSKPQDFRIYTGELSVGPELRPKSVATNVPGRATCKSELGFQNGTYVPRHAAMGLARTTTQGTYERIKVSRNLARSLPSNRETASKPLRDIPEHLHEHISQNMLPAGAAWGHNPDIEPLTKKCNNSKLEPNLEIVRPGGGDESIRKGELGPSTIDSTKPHLGSGDGEDLSRSSDEGVESKGRQKRTLRARISSMMILGRRNGDEVAAPVSQDPHAKPAIPRRKSMLLMFG
jgi:hypothetical protein